MKTFRVVSVAAAGALLSGVGFLAGLRWNPSSTASDSALRLNNQRTSKASATHARAKPAAPAVTSTGAPGAEAIEPGVADAAAARAALGRLVALNVTASEPRSIRALLVELERLRAAGPAALPAIREFLATAKDADYDAGATRAFRDGKVPLEFTVPPSLRLGLLEVVKNIGGPAAEALLAAELKTTGRGVEAAYLAGALQQMAPDKYRDSAVTAARDLLAMPLTATTKNPLDRSDREYLYQILATAGDRSQVAQAQADLLLPNGQIDRGALRYLQQTLGEDAVAVAVRAWDDPRVPATQKEPLARLALAYVGANADAERLYQLAINDPGMSENARKNLIEDLNEDGFANPRKLTPADLPLIQKRLALIDALAPRAKDPTNAAAFAEARKDLIAMRDSVVRTPPKK